MTELTDEAVEALRASADGYKHAAEGFAAELAAAKQREAALVESVIPIITKHVTMGWVQTLIIKKIRALAEVQARDDAPTPPDDTWHERRTMLPKGE